MAWLGSHCSRSNRTHREVQAGVSGLGRSLDLEFAGRSSGQRTPGCVDGAGPTRGAGRRCKHGGTELMKPTVRMHEQSRFCHGLFWLLGFTA